MKYDHRVKVGGKWFDAGVEVDATTTPVKPETKADKKESAKPSVESKFTRSQIQQMNGSELKETASKLGLSFSEDVANRELKQLIFDKLGM